MRMFEAWLVASGPRIADVLERKREQICETVSKRLATDFPTLCYDPTRYDAISFQKRTYYETPRRFHRLLQVLLQIQSLQVIEREYSWGWPVVRRYGVERYHMLSQVRWYFDAARVYATLKLEDHIPMNHLAMAILRTIEHVTRDPLSAQTDEPVRTNGFYP